MPTTRYYMFKKHHPLYWVVLFMFMLLVDDVFAQCSFERINTEKTVASYNQDKILELRDKNVVYLNRGIYSHALLNDSDTYNGLMEVTDACGTLLHSWVISYGAGEDAVYDALETTDGNILVLLYTVSYFSNVALMKVNPYTGYVYWKKTYPSYRPTTGEGISYHTYHNSYVVAGWSEFGGPNDTYKAYLLEVDTAGNLLQQLNYPPYTGGRITDEFNTYFLKAVALDSVRTMVVGFYNGTDNTDTNCFVHIYDREFNVLKRTFPFKGLYKGDHFRLLQWVGATEVNEQHQLVLYSQFIDNANKSGDLVVVIDSTGTMVKHTLMQESSTIHLTNDKSYVTATKDGGYLVPNGYIKLDSNLQVVSTVYSKDYKNISFNYAIQLSDSSYTGIAYGTAYSNELQSYYNALYTHRTNTKGWYTGMAQQAVATAKEIEVYPNPTSGIVTIKTTTQMGGKVTVVNALGKQVFNGELPWNNEINLSHLTNGVHWLTMHQPNGQLLTTKIVLSK